MKNGHQSVAVFLFTDHQDYQLRRTEALPVFTRTEERFDHLGSFVITVELVELREPKLITGVIGIRWSVRIASQVAVELHQHKRAVEFRAREIRMLGNLAQGLCPRLRAGCNFVAQRSDFAARQRTAGIAVQGRDVSGRRDRRWILGGKPARLDERVKVIDLVTFEMLLPAGLPDYQSATKKRDIIKEFGEPYNRHRDIVGGTSKRRSVCIVAICCLVGSLDQITCLLEFDRKKERC